MQKISNGLIKKQWVRLTNYSGKQRLSWFSIILLFGLDIYVLGMLFQGMTDASALIASPQLAISVECDNMTADFLRLDAGKRATSLKKYVLAKSADELAQGDYNNIKLLPVCTQLHEKLLSYVGNEELKNIFNELEETEGKISTAQEDIEKLKSSYDSALLEKIAGQKRTNSILPAEAGKIKGEVAAKNALLISLREQKNRIQKQLETHPLIGKYADFVTTLPFAAAFAKEHAEYEHLAYWYPIKVLAVEVSFLLPILLLAIIWNSRALKSQSNAQILITSHLILVCMFPIFCRIVYFFYDLLPHQFLANLIAWLDQLNLGFIWRYIAIAGGILACMLVIFIAQKTVFSTARMRATRLRKLLCRECGEKLHAVDQSCCESCGTSQTEDCRQCGKSNRMLANFCRHCGIASDAAI